MKHSFNHILFGSFLVGSLAFASGYTCESKAPTSEKLLVQLYNHTLTTTRVPAVFILAHEKEGTLLRRFDREIHKVITANTTQFIVEGNEHTEADILVFQVSHREGRETLRNHQAVEGQLILFSKGEKEVISLTCKRYLKG